MEPSKKKLKLDIINLNYKFQDLTLKRKNDIISDETKNKKVKLETNKDETKGKYNSDKDKTKEKYNSDKDKTKRKYNSDKDKIEIKKRVKIETKSCSQEYAEYNKKNNKENNNEPDEDCIKQFKRLPADDMIYRYII